MFDNIIFDFGQVLVHFDPLYMTEKYVSNKADITLLSEIVFDRIYWDKLDEGTGSNEEVKCRICERLPERLHTVAIEIYENWYLNIPLIEGMYEILTSLKEKGKKLFLLSNISKLFTENYHKNPDVKKILNLFDGLVFSGEIGIAKPDLKIFDYITKKYNLVKESTIFIDDNESNIKSAKEFGISAYLFDGNVQKLNDFLKTK